MAAFRSGIRAARAVAVRSNSIARPGILPPWSKNGRSTLAYSSRCCIGDVDLELVDAEAKTYRFVDPSRRQELQVAHELALPSALRVA